MVRKVQPPKEDPALAAARVAEEQRMQVQQQRADAAEITATKRLQARKTKQIARIFGNTPATAVGGLAGVSSAGVAAGGSVGNPAVTGDPYVWGYNLQLIPGWG